jgi:hypothetical protein
MDRHALEQEWLHLTRVTMPGLARERGWPIVSDHCFQRVLLDNAAGQCWYAVVSGRPAYAHADVAMLARAVALGKAVVAGSEDLAALNRHSLAWRGKGKIR